MKYDPKKSVRENAKDNNCTEASVRMYIKTMGISRKIDRVRNIVEDCRKVIEDSPSVTDENGDVIWNNLHKATGYSLSTLRKHRNEILSDGNILSERDKEFINLLGIPEEGYFGLDNLKLHGTIGINGVAYNIETLRDWIGALRIYGKVAKKCKDTLGIVYFGKSTVTKNAVKIGSTHDRLKLQRDNQLHTTFPGFHTDRIIVCPDRKSAFDLEHILHEKYKEFNIGGEWFNLPENVLNTIYEEYDAVK